MENSFQEKFKNRMSLIGRDGINGILNNRANPAVNPEKQGNTWEQFNNSEMKKNKSHKKNSLVKSGELLVSSQNRNKQNKHHNYESHIIKQHTRKNSRENSRNRKRSISPRHSSRSSPNKKKKLKETKYNSFTNKEIRTKHNSNHRLYNEHCKCSTLQRHIESINKLKVKKWKYVNKLF